MRGVLESQIACNLGDRSAQVRIVRVGECGSWWDPDLEALAGLLSIDGFTPTLGGPPLAVADVRSLSVAAHAEGRLLAVDNTIATSAGCPALRLGADVAVELLSHACGEAGEGLAAVAVASGADVSLPAPAELTSNLREELDAAYERFSGERTHANDAALTVASYLVCHPRVSHVWYPGLLRDQADSSRLDAANVLAPSILTGGFGPVLDYATVDAPDVPIRYVATPTDSLSQVMALEAARP